MKNKKIGILIAILIYILGISIIFVQSKIEADKITKEREKFYIVMDTNKKDVLKIEKKYFNSSSINKMKIIKTGDDKIYSIEDKKLMEDIMDKMDFLKFVSDSSLNMSTEDITFEIVTESNVLSITMSQENKVATLKYNDSTLLVTVTDEFYDMIYSIYDKVKS